jgi:superfamily II DNA/RNA helicase
MRRITCCLQNMRMLCDSTFLFDKQTNHSPKLEEFREIIRELALEENRKVVVFSEYERMTHLAGEELGKLGIGCVSLHGGVPSRKRGDLIEKFRRDPECKVFLSTDAGGVGLNLQAASAVVNFEPPWNPARLEQRIGRVHRLGQSRSVHVIHLLTTGSIEERVWETLQRKKSLFAGVFDSPQAEVSFAALGRKSGLEAMKEVVADRPERPKPVVEQARPAAPPARPETPPDTLGKAAAGLLEAGIKFLESMTSETSDRPLEQVLSGLISRDPGTNRPVLSIPLPESITEGRLTNALAGLLGKLR